MRPPLQNWRSPGATLACIDTRALIVSLSLVLLAIAVGAFALAVPQGFVDERLLRDVQLLHPGMPQAAWLFNDFLHRTGIPILWGATIVVWLLARRPGFAALFAIALVSGALNILLKDAFDRPRPAGLFSIREFPGDASFPSGHTMTAAVFCGLWFLAAPHVLGRWSARAVQAGMAAVVLLTALLRVWAGAHWPTDVLGGALFGTALVALTWSLRVLVDRALATLPVLYQALGHRYWGRSRPSA
jgi:membrane-associated phospholipid phosphatase